MSITIIAAMTKERVIGKEGQMPWYIKEELALFRSLTLHHSIVMGKTTFNLLKQPLEGRFTYVITKESSGKSRWATVAYCDDLKGLLENYRFCKEALFVCGGAQIYQQAMPYADHMLLSLIHEDYQGDTYFPDFQWTDWTIVRTEVHTLFDFYELIRKT